MSFLFARELRRQAPVAAASVVLGLLFVALGLAFGRGPNGGLFELTLSGFVVSSIAASLLLGIASFAPDVESGAAAFIATLPISRRRELATRWGVATLLCIAAIAASSVPVWLVSRTPWSEQLDEVHARRFVFAVVGGLGSGFVASLIGRRTLVAFLVAPAVGLVPYLLFAEIGDRFFAPFDVEVVAAVVLIPALFALGAWVHARCDVHVDWRRGTLVTSAVLGALLVVGSGAVTACWAFDLGALWAIYGVVPSHDGRSAVVIECHGSSMWRRASRATTIDLETGHRLAVLQDAVAVLSFSPSGRSALLAESDGESEALVDLRTGASSRRNFRAQEPAERTSTPSLHVWSSYMPRPPISAVIWDGEEPVSVVTGRRWSKDPIALPEIKHIEAAAGGWLIARDGELRFAVDAQGRRRELSLPPVRVDDLALSPSGRLVVLLGEGSSGAELWSIPIDAPAAARRLALDPPTSLSRIYLAFSPGEDRVDVIAGLYASTGRENSYRTTLFDVRDGRALRPSVKKSPLPIAWSPSGRREVFTDDTWRDADGAAGHVDRWDHDGFSRVIGCDDENVFLIIERNAGFKLETVAAHH
jgi:hypothetical protein